MALSQAEESRGLMSILEPVEIEAVGGKHCRCPYHQWCSATYFLPSHHKLRLVLTERSGLVADLVLSWSGWCFWAERAQFQISASGVRGAQYGQQTALRDLEIKRHNHLRYTPGGLLFWQWIPGLPRGFWEGGIVWGGEIREGEMGGGSCMDGTFAFNIKGGRK